MILNRLPLLFLHLFISCGQANHREHAIKNEIANKADTLYVPAPALIFFTISKEEYNYIPLPNDISDVLSDFNHYSKLIADELPELKVYFSTNKHFCIKLKNESVVISRDSSINFVGVIIADIIKPPMVKYGVYTEIDYRTMIHDYFNR